MTNQLPTTLAYLQRDPSGLSDFLYEHLISLGLKVVWSDEVVASQEFLYGFVVVDLTQTGVTKQVETFIQNLGRFSKACLVILTNSNSSSQQELDKITSYVSAHSDPAHHDLRLVVLHHLYGPAILASNPVNDLMLQLPTGRLVTKAWQQELVYPLHADDAVELICKATFARSTKGVVFETGGLPVTYLNLCLAIKDLAGVAELVPKDSSQNPSQDLATATHLTQTKLNFRPRTILQTGLWESVRVANRRTITSTTNEPEILPEAEITPIETPVVVEAPPPPPPQAPPSPPEPEPAAVLPEPPTKTFKDFDFVGHNKATILNLTTQSPQPNKPPSNKSEKAISVRRGKRFWAFVSLGVVVGLVLTLHAWVGFNAYRLAALTSTLESQTQEPDPAKLASQLSWASWHHTQVDNYFRSTGLAWRLLLGQSRYSDWSLLLSASGQMLQALDEASTLVPDLEGIGDLVLSGAEGDLPRLAKASASRLSQIYHKLSLAQTDLRSIQGNLPERVMNQVDQVDARLTQARHLAGQGQYLLQVLPELTGIDGRRTYMVLLQNNMELRPTGGFIGSYATVVFEKGRLIDLKVEDVYAADGQLKGYVKPPEPIERHLGEASWFLRDSNWSPNFPTSAETAAWFINKQMGLVVDGVIGVNLYVVQDLLRSLGPIDLVDYQETITADNLYQRAQYQSEINFFPGSTQKRDYLGQLTRMLYQRIKDADQKELATIFQSLLRSADQKQIIMYLANQTANQAVIDLGWSGQVESGACVSGQECVADYLATIEANLGVNKANYFLKRDRHSRISLTTDKVVHTHDLILENTSEGNVWPGGPYRAYVRYFIPKSAAISSVKVAGKTLDAKSYDLSEELGKAVVGLFVDIPGGERQVVSVSYELEAKMGPTLPYQLYLQKQSGTHQDLFNLTLEIDPALGDFTTNLNPADTGARSVQLPLNTDHVFRVEFGPNS